MSDKVVALLRKLKALADRGEGGEKENAERMLVEFLKKHDISLSQLQEDDLEDRIFKVPVRYKQLFIQVAASILGRERSIYGVRGYPSNVMIECSVSEYTELQMAFDFYRDALAEQLELFEEAFYQKNKLFPLGAGGACDIKMTNEDLARLDRLMALMRGMTRVNHKKLLD